MEKLTFSKLSLTDLKRWVTLQEGPIASYEWLQIDSISLTDHEQRQLQDIQSRLLNYDTQLMNEATIWARGIYPLLSIAEQGSIQAWAQVAMQAQYANFEIEGIADGVLGNTVAGRLESPYVVVVETKKGIEGQNPVSQLYGQLLAAAHLNWEPEKPARQEIFGCYTIADTWKLVRAQIDGIDSEKPLMHIEFSREYVEKLEAETILKVLKKMVNKYANQGFHAGGIH